MNAEHTAEDVRWGRVRFALGMAQMAVPVFALVLLVGIGVASLSLVAVVVASLLTSVSVMLFGSRRGDRRVDA